MILCNTQRLAKWHFSHLDMCIRSPIGDLPRNFKDSFIRYYSYACSPFIKLWFIMNTESIATAECKNKNGKDLGLEEN
jgi:hypothetical protein